MGVLVNMSASLSKYKYEETIALLSKSFPGDRLFLRDFFYKVLTLIPHRRFIFYTSEKKIKGFFLLLKRQVWLGGKLFSVCGMSYMVVDEKLKNLSASAFLKKKLFEESYKSDLTIGFARKVMDRYWYHYGFLGVSSFSKFSISLKSFQQFKDDNISYSDSTCNNDIEDLNKIYTLTYKHLYGSFLRDREAWSYLLFSGVKKFKLIKVLNKGKVWGYFFYKNNEIYEVGVKNKQYRKMLQAIYLFFNSKKSENLIFNLSFNHELIKRMSIYSHERYEKFVPEGGHLIRINNIKRFIKKISPVLEKQYLMLNLKPFTKKINGIIFSFSKNALKVTYDEYFKDDNLTKLQVAAFIFMLPPESTHNDILFNPLCINFSELDQF